MLRNNEEKDKNSKGVVWGNFMAISSICLCHLSKTNYKNSSVCLCSRYNLKKHAISSTSMGGAHQSLEVLENNVLNL